MRPRNDGNTWRNIDIGPDGHVGFAPDHEYLVAYPGTIANPQSSCKKETGTRYNLNVLTDFCTRPPQEIALDTKAPSGRQPPEDEMNEVQASGLHHIRPRRYVTETASKLISSDANARAAAAPNEPNRESPFAVQIRQTNHAPLIPSQLH